MAHVQRGEQTQAKEPEDQTVASYQSIDPWAPSIHQSIHNRRADGIQNIDDIGLPNMLPYLIFLRQYLSQQPQRTSVTQAPYSIPQSTSIPRQRRGQVRPVTAIRHTTPLQKLPPTPSSRPTRTPGTIFRDANDGVVRARQLNKDLPTIPIWYKLRQMPLIQIPRFPDQESLELQDYVFAFLSDTLPRQIYLHFLLRLPSLYFSRVDRIFTDADLTLSEIKDMALCATAEDSAILYTHMLNFGHDVHSEVAIDSLPPSYRRLKDGWESFIDNLMKEWKTLNIVSGLLVA